MDDFLLRALLAGIAIALVTGPVGVFVVWRRMSYFGDTLSHSAILGVAIGILLNINIQLGILMATLGIAILLILLLRQQHIGNDTLLGILAHTALSLGLILLSFIQNQTIDLNAWLFGDILTVSWQDIGFILSGSIVISGILLIIWRPLLAMTVHEELARVEGINVPLTSAIYTLLIALIVAVSMKVVGALLITSMLIIPAAAARNFARSPEQMAIFSIVIGIAAVICGLLLSYFQDTPAAPSIVVSAATLFLLSQLVRKT